MTSREGERERERAIRAKCTNKTENINSDTRGNRRYTYQNGEELISTEVKMHKTKEPGKEINGK